MQDELIQKSQQIVNSKSQYYKKTDQSSFKNIQKRPKAKKKFNSNASEYLSFKVDKKDPIVKTYKPQIQTNNEITLSPYYRFAVKQGDYRQFHSDPNQPLDWDSVRKVRILTDSEVKCPICLEQQLLAGRANKCGHYYCWPCVIRYMWVSEGQKRCPVCNYSLRSLDLRPVSVKVYNHITEGSLVELTLVKRPKGFVTLFSAAHALAGTNSGMIASDSVHTWLNRISIYSEAVYDYNEERAQLSAALGITFDEFEKSSIEKAIELLDKNFASGVTTQEFLEEEREGFYYFYQISDCQPYFLHPLNMSMMKKQFGSFELCPVNLRCRLLEIERIHITEADQRKYGQLSHLGKNVIAYFIELDLKNLISDSIQNEYKQEVITNQLSCRHRDRARYKRIEEKIQQKISIRRKNDEEANNLLLSYFDNPVVAPVHRTVSEVKVEVKEENKEEEEEKVDSKSIWSNFKEVLKRPPREKVVVEKEVEVEEEGPKKLTMFDLIRKVDR